jgi:DNA polymerase (family X)
MPQPNDTAAALLDEYADRYVMTGGDPFRARVYGKAARAVAAYPQDVAGLTPAARQRIPGVGKSIAGKIAEIANTGSFAELEDLRASIPDGVRLLTKIPAVGPRRALQLYRFSAGRSASSPTDWPPTVTGRWSCCTAPS